MFIIMTKDSRKFRPPYFPSTKYFRVISWFEDNLELVF